MRTASIRRSSTSIIFTTTLFCVARATAMLKRVLAMVIISAVSSLTGCRGLARLTASLRATAACMRSKSAGVPSRAAMRATCCSNSRRAWMTAGMCAAGMSGTG